MSTMIDQKSNTVKSVQKKSEIQVNRSIRTGLGISRDSLKVITRRGNKLENWSNESLTPTELAEIVTEGYTIRPGIRTASNKQVSVTHAEWIVLDFDQSTLKQTLDVPLTQQASFYHWSASYKKNLNEKHHLFFQLSRQVTPEEYEIIYNNISNNHYPFADRATASNGFLFFGGSPVHKEYTLIGGILDVEPLLNEQSVAPKAVAIPTVAIAPINHGKVELPDDESDSKVTLKTTKNTEKGGYRHQANLWINKIWIGVCGNDIDKLYCLFPHRFTDSGSDDGNIAKWGGKNPFSKEPNEPGTGFFVHWGDTQYAPIWRNQSEGTNGNFIDYWHKFGIALYNKKFGDIQYMKDRQNIEYQKVLDDIAKHFGVEKFEYVKDESDDYQEILQNLTDKYLKVNESSLYHVYSTKSYTWSVTKDLDTIWREGYMSWIRTENPELIGKFSSVKLVSKAKQKLMLGILDIPFMMSKTFSDKKNPNIIPMFGGDFDINTKKLQPYNPDNLNTHRNSFAYIPNIKDSDVREFLDYMEIVYKDQETRQFIINWLAANIMGNAWKIKAMVNVYGTPGSGKSTLNNFIGHLCDASHTTIDASQFKSNSNFLYQNLASSNVVTIDEFNKMPAESWDNIKKISGGESLIEINQKGLRTFKVTCKVGLTTFSQDNFTIPSSSDGGILRRIIPIEHGKEMIDERVPELLNTICEYSYYEKLFNWLIQLKPTDVLATLNSYAKSCGVEEKLQKIVTESDEIINFINECLEVTDSTKYISYQQLQEVFKDYLENQNGGVDLSPSDKNKIKFIVKAIRQKANIKEAKFNWLHANDKEARVTIGGKQLRVLYGLSIKNQEQTTDNF